MKLSSIFEPAVVLIPLVQKISLCARGIPVKAVALPALMQHRQRWLRQELVQA